MERPSSEYGTTCARPRVNKQIRRCACVSESERARARDGMTDRARRRFQDILAERPLDRTARQEDGNRIVGEASPARARPSHKEGTGEHRWTWHGHHASWRHCAEHCTTSTKNFFSTNHAGNADATCNQV
eukprot:3932326-Rhodomonas_salina.2